jgi:hypothetical protein
LNRPNLHKKPANRQARFAFRRSAQRFFINSDNRFLAAGLILPRRPPELLPSATAAFPEPAEERFPFSSDIA